MTTVITPPVCEVHRYHWPRPLRIVTHHIWPQSQGGPDTPANTVHVCDTGHLNAHRLYDNLERGEPMVGGTRKERALAQQGYDAWVAAGKPGHLVYELHDRLALLPPPSGRKGGALPSPRDDRDYQARLPKAVPSSVNYGAGLTFGMLLNDRIGDCYPAALLHALQVLTAGTYTPSDADVLHVYEQVTGYDPTRTQPDGSNPTDNGTAGRPLFSWAKSRGLITSYAAVPADRVSIRAAIAAHKAVLCEWALPTGCETEGDVWTMPRTGRVAGSWGGHATVEVGYTSRRNRNVTWGQEGTVTPPFEDAYLQAAWAVTAPAVVPPIR